MKHKQGTIHETSYDKLLKHIIPTVKFLVFVIACSLLFSCAKSRQNANSDKTHVAACPESTPVPIPIGYLQTQPVFSCAGQDLSVTFTHLLEDSRCPGDVMCPWAGRAIIGFMLSSGGSEIVVELGKSVQFDWNGFTILARFTQLTPYPVSTTAINVNDYIATIEFSVI